MKNIQELCRYKKNIPFSDSLNNIVQELFEDIDIHIIFSADDPYSSFEEMKEDITNNNRLLVSILYSDKTIFGSPEMNWRFRSIHDWLHYKLDVDFSVEGELIVNHYQRRVFAMAGANQFDLDLLDIETASQVLYVKKHGEFPDDQRQFAIKELIKLGY